MKALNLKNGELMFLSNEEKSYLNQTLVIANKSVENGNHPFGALLVYEGKVICTSENKVITTNDIRSHAELLLIQMAQKVLSTK